MKSESYCGVSESIEWDKYQSTFMLTSGEAWLDTWDYTTLYSLEIGKVILS